MNPFWIDPKIKNRYYPSPKLVKYLVFIDWRNIYVEVWLEWLNKKKLIISIVEEFKCDIKIYINCIECIKLFSLITTETLACNVARFYFKHEREMFFNSQRMRYSPWIVKRIQSNNFLYLKKKEVKKFIWNYISTLIISKGIYYHFFWLKLIE